MKKIKQGTTPNMTKKTTPIVNEFLEKMHNMRFATIVILENGFEKKGASIVANISNTNYIEGRLRQMLAHIMCKYNEEK